jgi:uncharacterized protein YjbI with pentapeptide repeats
MRAPLLWTDLHTSTLIEANLQGADLRGVRYNEHTIWPDGFDPMAAGAIYMLE